VDDTRTKRQPKDTPAATSDEKRRRIGKVVHDDRGQASLEWYDAPDDYERPVLELLGNPELSLEKEEKSFDPYARHTEAPGKAGEGPAPARTDLRKLSEWIKMKRELEQRKLEGDDEDPDED
jgi:hypothetical protein